MKITLPLYYTKRDIMDIKIKVKAHRNANWQDVILHSVKPLSHKPKSYKKIGLLYHNIGNAYNSDLITIYEAKKPSNNGSKYRFSMYRDGCFYPYYGILTVINGTTLDF